ncbi:MAG: hypothetical protein PVG84_13330 [Desulfobacterales bacterium]
MKKICRSEASVMKFNVIDEIYYQMHLIFHHRNSEKRFRRGADFDIYIVLSDSCDDTLGLFLEIRSLVDKKVQIV